MKWVKRVFGCLFGLFLLVSLTMAAVGQQRSRKWSGLSRPNLNLF